MAPSLSLEIEPRCIRYQPEKILDVIIEGNIITHHHHPGTPGSTMLAQTPPDNMAISQSLTRKDIEKWVNATTTIAVHRPPSIYTQVTDTTSRPFKPLYVPTEVCVDSMSDVIAPEEPGPPMQESYVNNSRDNSSTNTTKLEQQEVFKLPPDLNDDLEVEGSATLVQFRHDSGDYTLCFKPPLVMNIPAENCEKFDQESLGNKSTHQESRQQNRELLYYEDLVLDEQLQVQDRLSQLMLTPPPPLKPQRVLPPPPLPSSRFHAHRVQQVSEETQKTLSLPSPSPPRGRSPLPSSHTRLPRQEHLQIITSPLRARPAPIVPSSPSPDQILQLTRAQRTMSLFPQAQRTRSITPPRAQSARPVSSPPSPDQISQLTQAQRTMSLFPQARRKRSITPPPSSTQQPQPQQEHGKTRKASPPHAKPSVLHRVYKLVVKD